MTGKSKQTYEIGDGVRRSKAAQELGPKTIKAEDHTGKSMDIPIENLRSPMKNEIDVSTPKLQKQYQDIYDATKAGKISTFARRRLCLRRVKSKSPDLYISKQELCF